MAASVFEFEMMSSCNLAWRKLIRALVSDGSGTRDVRFDHLQAVCLAFQCVFDQLRQVRAIAHFQSAPRQTALNF